MKLLIDTNVILDMVFGRNGCEVSMKLFDILSVTGADIQEAFIQRWKDFEDCVQYITAKNNRIDYYSVRLVFKL